MFYIWHTLLVTAFIGIAYYLGYQFGLKKKIKVASQKKLWKALKTTPKQEVEVAISTVSPNKKLLSHILIIWNTKLLMRNG